MIRIAMRPAITVTSSLLFKKRSNCFSFSFGPNGEKSEMVNYDCSLTLYRPSMGLNLEHKVYNEVIVRLITLWRRFAMLIWNTAKAAYAGCINGF